jgi:HK97 family phage major capsid protein
MKHLRNYETRSAEPIESRNEPEGGGDLATAIQAVTELRTAVDTHRTAFDTRLTTEMRSLTERLDAIDVRTQRPGAGGSQTDDEAVQLERRAFGGFLRRGREVLPDLEARALRVSDDTAGGYLAPSEFVAEVIKGIVQYSPVRQAARVGNTSSGEVILPKRTGTPTASWVGETEDRTETGSSYGQLQIPIHEMACYVDVSLRLLEDAAVNVEAEVASDLAEEFGRLEGVAFVNGNGVKKPMGFMAAPELAYTPNKHATVLSADELITFLYAMPAVYRSTGAWMLNGNTLATVRRLKDGQNNFLWQPSYQAGQPETLLGRPVIEAVDMPDVASGTFPIAFGDFARAYRIYDRVALSIMRDPYTMATKGLVRFHARRRVGGDVVLAEALRKFKMSVS